MRKLVHLAHSLTTLIFTASLTVTIVGGSITSTSLAASLQDESTNALDAPCAALKNLNLETAADSPANILTATLVTGQKATPNDQKGFSIRSITQGLPIPQLKAWPDHCLVEGYVTPHVKFSMMLPPHNIWNERFYLSACEGWCGAVNPHTMIPALYSGYAVITNDGGHYGGTPFDAIWAYNNLDARINFAHRANHVSAQVGKAVIEAYYGAKPKYSYIAGVSKGGNAGLFAAQRYPDDFDGVFSKAPVVNYNPKNAAHMPWIAKAVYPDGKTPLLYSDKVPLIQAAVNTACDAIDGLEDGLISDPRKCHFDPGVLLCTAGQSETENECLTAPQIEAVRKIYAKPVSADGTVYFNYPNDPGSENEWPGVILPIRGAPFQPAFYAGAVSGLYMAFKDSPEPGYDWLNFDYTKYETEIAEMSEILDPDSPDLTAFKARGGKIIVVHGWADGLITANMTIDWFEKMQTFMGGRKATSEFAQLYTLPGVNHVAGGPGPIVYDAHSALVRWVEEGVAPEQLLITDKPDAEPFRERPAFPYPARAEYKGKGDPNKASSFHRAE